MDPGPGGGRAGVPLPAALPAVYAFRSGRHLCLCMSAASSFPPPCIGMQASQATHTHTPVHLCARRTSLADVFPLAPALNTDHRVSSTFCGFVLSLLCQVS